MNRAERVRWFAREVLPHEGAVRSWLARRVRGLRHCDVDEIIQEAYARLWAAEIERISNPRAYFFVTVRHLVGEALRRSRIVAIETLADVDSLNIVDEGGGPERRVSGREELGRLLDVLDRMPRKCRWAFELRKLEGCSQRETAERMEVSENTVEKHLVKALKIIMEVTSATAAEEDWSKHSDQARRKRR
ncbi:MAG TPA: sigma-70 family RNA polymerase sigma factor [Steroidobacteraceae bacterium]|jgi:RNA polymerase sigma factor (sigma-70 family)|nr:sigma-70 family RNA polymerase sigma factor [Steroidobacteraceae bacterium]